MLYREMRVLFAGAKITIGYVIIGWMWFLTNLLNSDPRSMTLMS